MGTNMSERNKREDALIKVIAVGGAGGNALKHIQNTPSPSNVEYWAVNTDAQALEDSDPSTTQIAIGIAQTRGMGAHADAEFGRKIALAESERIQQLMEGADAIVLLLGLGGGTGTGVSPIIAEMAKKQGILTLAVATLPFPFEGRKRMEIATKGLDELTHHVDSLTIIPNERILQSLGKSTTLLDAFKAANTVAQQIVSALTGALAQKSLRDRFQHEIPLFRKRGYVYAFKAEAEGESRASSAAVLALNSPLQENLYLKEAKAALLKVEASKELNRNERNELSSVVRKMLPNTDVYYEFNTVRQLGNKINIEVIATGMKSLMGYSDFPVEQELSSSICILTSQEKSNEEIAELIDHLSTIYNAEGGDELEIKGIHDLPPIAKFMLLSQHSVSNGG